MTAGGGGPTAPSSPGPIRVWPRRSPTPQGPYRIEENVVKARGGGHSAARGGAASLLPQPEPPQEPKQHQEHEEEEGAAHCGRH